MPSFTSGPLWLTLMWPTPTVFQDSVWMSLPPGSLPNPPNTGLGISPGFLQHAVLIDTTTPFSGNLLVHPLQQDINSMRAGPTSHSLLDVPGVEDDMHSINVCSTGEWNTKNYFLLKLNAEDRNLQYQYLRKNNFKREKGNYFTVNTSVTTWTQETVLHQDQLSQKGKNKEDKQIRLLLQKWR